MKITERYARVLAYFEATQPEPKPELAYTNPFSLLVAVVLSAQCTDKRVNMVTPALMEAYPTPADMAQATEEEVLGYVASVSYPNAKARHLVGLARRLHECFGDEVPMKLEDLVTLPGVGRKTANVVLAVAAGAPTMAVDTHVFRVSHRLGLVPDTAMTPLAVERSLTRHIPESLIPHAHHWLILHGRYTCRSRNPLCKDCGLTGVCKYFLQKTPNL